MKYLLEIGPECCQFCYILLSGFCFATLRIVISRSKVCDVTFIQVLEMFLSRVSVPDFNFEQVSPLWLSKIIIEILNKYFFNFLGAKAYFKFSFKI